MSRQPLAVTATGMVTGVGLDVPSTCAAIRAAIDNFKETRFMDSGGEWIQGCEVPLEQPWRGTRKLAKLLAMALKECAEDGGVDLATIPIILCLAEKERPGRVEDLGNRIFFETQEELGFQFSNQFKLVEHGRVGGLVAMRQARQLIYEKQAKQIIIAGIDSLLNSTTLGACEELDRLLTSQNSNGFIPGEAASAILVEAPKAKEELQLVCLGLGFGVEEATIDSELPLKADGLSAALHEAFNESGTTMNDMDFRIVDVAGEQYWFKESALVIGRFIRVHKEDFPLWHITDCIGEVGAAIVGASIAYAKMAYDKSFDEGKNVLQHFSNNNGKRGAAVFSHTLVTSRG